MNVDILCEYGSLNGGENSMLALLPLLKEHGVTFRVVCPPTGPLAETLNRFDIETVPFELRTGTSLEERRHRLGKLLWNLRSRLVHANSLAMGRVAGVILADMCTPSIVHLRDIIRLNRSAVADLNRFRRILVVSEATRRFHVDQGLHATSCHVMYNGVDLEQFRPTPPNGYLHRELGLPPEAKLLAVIGQIGLRKGQDMLLDVLSPIFSRRTDVHLLLVGQRWSSKPESLRFEQEIQARIKQEPFRKWHDERVHVLGVRDDVPRLLNELTLLVHPARQEPLGRVLLEAAACGIPVVATDVGGTREIFPDSDFPRQKDAASARIVPVNSPEVFYQAVETLLDDLPLRHQLGVAARHRAETAFAREIAAENLYRHYEAVLGGD